MKRLKPPQDLVHRAREVAKRAYCPDSHYHVGAIVVDQENRLFAGVNVENSCYNLGMCAERTAVGAAVTGGMISLKSATVVGRGDIVPCGGCLQVLAEFGDDNMPIYYSTLEDDGVIRHTTLGALLTRPFRLKREK